MKRVSFLCQRISAWWAEWGPLWAQVSQWPRSQDSVLGILTALALAMLLTADASQRSLMLTIFTALHIFLFGLGGWRMRTHWPWIIQDPDRAIHLLGLRAGIDGVYMLLLIFSAADVAQRWPAGWGFGFL